jgi:cysteine desulfurase
MSHVPPVYLDHAATTPMHPAAIEAMTAACHRRERLLASYRGPGGPAPDGGVAGEHRRAAGRPAFRGLFTSGGTESDNLALKGIYWARRDADENRRRIITTAVEHHAVLDAVGWLVHHEQAEVTLLPTGPDGSVTPAALRAALEEYGDDVALASVMWANNEVGTIMPIAELAASQPSSTSRCTPTPSRRRARCRSTSRPAGVGDERGRAQVRRSHGVGALLLRRDTACVPLLTAAARSVTCVRAHRMSPVWSAMAAAADIAVEAWRHRRAAAAPCGTG